jgi:hypothetical protein
MKFKSTPQSSECHAELVEVQHEKLLKGSLDEV